jgi:hypothetical protein
VRNFRIEMSRGRIVAAILLLLVSVAAAVAAFSSIPPKYASSAQVVFLSGTKDPNGHGANPFLGFTDSLNITAGVIATAVSSPTSVEGIVAAGGSRTFSISASGGNAPVMLVTATAGSPAQAQHTVVLLEGDIATQLKQRQAAIGAPEGTLVSVMPITDVSKPTRVVKSAIQLALGVLAACIFGSLALLVALDRRLKRRAASRAEHVEPSGENSVEETARSAQVVPQQRGRRRAERVLPTDTGPVDLAPWIPPAPTYTEPADPDENLSFVPPLEDVAPIDETSAPAQTSARSLL